MLALIFGAEARVFEILISLPDESISNVAMVNRDISQTWLCTIKLYHILKLKVNSNMQYSVFHFGNIISIFMAPTTASVL